MKYCIPVLLLAMALLLTACIPTVTNPTGSVPTTTAPWPTTTASMPTTTTPQPTTAAPISTTTDPVPTTTAPVTTTTDPPPTDPIPTTIPQNTAELAVFNELFQHVPDKRNAYSFAIAHEYSSATELKLRYFFDNGFPGEYEVTDLEWAELKDLPGFNINYDFFRLPKAKMEADLQYYFGVSLADIPDSGFEGLTYLKSTDCYYFMATGAMTNSSNFTAQHVDYNSDGIASLTYTVGWEPTVEKYVIELKPTDDGYLILSNLVAE